MQQVFDSLGYQVDWFRSMMVGSLILTRFVIVVNLVPFLFGKPVPAMLRQLIAISGGYASAGRSASGA